MIKINGEFADNDGKTVLEVLTMMNINTQRVAVELNQSIVPRSAYDTTFLQDGDSVEIVRFVGGG